MTTGIDVLEEDHFAPLAALAAKHGGKLRLGLLTNQTGLDAQGRRTIDILVHEAEAAVPGLKLKLLFSPEHGINGALDKEGIQNGKDSSTGLPVVSLYGASAADRRPSLETLHGLDAVLIDLQDAGVRFYTYETVVRYFLEVAGRTIQTSSSSTVPIRSPAHLCRARFPMREARATSTSRRYPCATV